MFKAYIHFKDATYTTDRLFNVSGIDAGDREGSIIVRMMFGEPKMYWNVKKVVLEVVTE